MSQKKPAAGASSPSSSYFHAVKPLSLSLAEARRLFLRQQGLYPDERPAGALAALRQLGYVQIDTISVIERAHHHVLWSRVPAYRPADLQQMQSEEKSVFEYWSHAAAILPMEDYRFSLPNKMRLAAGERHWFEREPEVMQYVLDRIRAEGPLQARDFEKPEGFAAQHMWDWKPAKRALEQLFMDGRLMVAGRKGFQKLFDLPERVLPAWVDTRPPSALEFGRHLWERTLGACGLAAPEEVCYLRAWAKGAVMEGLRSLLDEGALRPVQPEGHKGAYYAFADVEQRIPAAVPVGPLQLLSPFDNAVIQRRRLKRLFGFDYFIECYVPAAKRKFGYFCLPILDGEFFIGQADLKADRSNKRLLLQGLWLDGDREAIRPRLSEALQAFAAFNGCGEVLE